MSNKKGNSRTTRVEEEVEVETPKKGIKFMVLLNFAGLPIFLGLAILTSFYLLSHNFRTSTCDCAKYLVRLYPEQWNLETKLVQIFTAWGGAAVVILGNVFLVMNMRMLGMKPSPYKYQDPVYISLVNRIIANTMEQTMVFVPLFSFYVLAVATEVTRDITAGLILVFLFGRLMFTVGYLFQELSNLIWLRVWGFAMTLLVNILLASAFFGHDLTPRFVTLVGGLVEQYYGKL